MLNYKSGDVLALFQAVQYAREASVNLPNWAVEPLEETYLDALLDRKPGRKGKGNSAFGDLKRAYKRSVRASAYFYVRAWQKDPHKWEDLPVSTMERWFADKTNWLQNRTAPDARRLASEGLIGTDHTTFASTIRKAAAGMRPPIRWGRRDVEEGLGLRGPGCVFGRPTIEKSPHVLKLLETRAPKP